uniref:Myosin regulatory light chain n=1 Tax=Antonospora locustae TaxID=278021 RepID=Q6E6B0_ANTLO|nr:myosin regulatory light chain [Antonospora locustae]|eukprot:jgi/Antlo1/951/1056
MRRSLRRKDSNIFGMFSQEQINTMREVFNMLDVDNDAFLTKSDLVAISESIGNPLTDAEIDRMVGDRKISYMMLLTMIGERLSEIEPEHSLIAAFKMFDSGDGKIDEKDLRHWLINEGDRMDQDSVDFFIKDVVNGGKVDYIKLAGIMKRGEALERSVNQ